MPTTTNLDLQSVELVSVLHTAPANGAPSSADYYDGELEKITDLATLVSFINNVLLPMFNALPPQAATGLEGTSIYSDIAAQDALVYDSLTGQPLTVTESMRVLNGRLQTMQTTVIYLSQQVSSLQARLSASGQDDISLALQGITSTLAAQAAQIINLSNTISGLQVVSTSVLDAKVQTPMIGPGALETVIVNWSIAFPDNNYVVIYGMEDISGSLTITGFSYLDNGVGLRVNVLNTDTTGSHQGYVHAEGRSSQLTG